MALHDRPRVLWIPHAPWAKLAGQRPYHLIRRLCGQFEVHVLSWVQRRTLRALGHSRTYTPPEFAGHVVVHEVCLAPNVYRLAVRGYPPQLAVVPNQALFRRHMRRILSRHRFDLGVFASSHHFTGFPCSVTFPVVFDYLDLSPPHIEAAYCRTAAAVLAASPVLAARAAAHGCAVALVPNGVTISRFREAHAAGVRVRAALGLEQGQVVSLIGLTASPTPYYVDAVARLHREGARVTLLAVGEGPLRTAIAARAEALGVPVALPGWVPPEDVAGYFGATDVGLYPGEDTPYFRAALPLKVLEYGAAGKPVVSTPVDAYAPLGLAHATVVPPSADAFAAAIGQALRRPLARGPVPAVLALDWDRLAERAGAVLERTMASCAGVRDGQTAVPLASPGGRINGGGSRWRSW